MNKIKSIIVAILFLIFASGSAVVNFNKTPPKNLNSEVFISAPLIKINDNAVFVVLNSSEAEIILINNGVRVLSAPTTGAKDKRLNYFGKIPTVNYYVWIGKSDGCYCYKLIDAQTFKLLYINIGPKLDSRFIMAPFVHKIKRIDMKFAQYILTFKDDKYNNIINTGSSQEVNKACSEYIKKSDEILNDKITANKKEKAAYFNDKYAVHLNLATNCLLMRDFVNCEANILKAEEISMHVRMKNNYDLEGAYSKILNSKKIELQNAIKDSIDETRPKTNSEKKVSVKLYYKNHEGMNYDENHYASSRAEDRGDLYAAVELFQCFSDKIDMYEWELVASFFENELANRRQLRFSEIKRIEDKRVREIEQRQGNNGNPIQHIRDNSYVTEPIAHIDSNYIIIQIINNKWEVGVNHKWKPDEYIKEIRYSTDTYSYNIEISSNVRIWKAGSSYMLATRDFSYVNKLFLYEYRRITGGREMINPLGKNTPEEWDALLKKNGDMKEYAATEINCYYNLFNQKNNSFKEIFSIDFFNQLK